MHMSRNLAQMLLAATLLSLGLPSHAQSSLSKILGNVLGGNSSSGQQKSKSKNPQGDAASKPAAAAPEASNSADEEERRLRELKTALKLTPDQDAAWQAYETSVKALAYDLMHPAEPASAPDQTAPQKVDQKVDAARSRLASMQQISDSAKKLYQGLSDDQKAVANKLLDGTIPPFSSATASAQRTRTPQASQASSAQASGGTWYYCESAKAYYPTVQTCPEAWRQVTVTQH